MNKQNECIDLSEFHEIPGFSKYCIAKDGRLYSKCSNILRKWTTTTPYKGRPGGYRWIGLRHDDGYVVRISRHRLLMTIFNHPGENINNLVVNHLDGIPGSDSLENLEWTTQRGNILHAGAMGLSPKCCPILVRDIDTLEIQKFPSMIDCARYYNVSKDFIQYRLKSKP